MIQNLLDRKPLLIINFQDLLDQVSGLLRDRIRQLVIPSEDLAVQLLLGGVSERNFAVEHGVEHDTTAPDVRFEPVVALLSEHFRGDVDRGA